MPIKYSVVMPTYNRERFLRRSITSVLTQDCVEDGSIELLVIDDGSEDNTKSLVESITANDKGHVLKYVRLNHVGEPGTVRNTALDMVTGQFVAYCDSDDYWLPHHLATAIQRFKKKPEMFMVSNYWGLASFEYFEGQIHTQLIVPPHPTWAVNTNCRVHRAECLAVGRFNTSRWGEDQDFFQRIEARYPCDKTGIVTSVNGYIKNGNNLTYQFDAGVKQRYF